MKKTRKKSRVLAKISHVNSQNKYIILNCRSSEEK